ncbi:WIAG-tail domain, partial [Paenibacillus fonticola]|uniref:WIAG-tail domain n=1 Tax=Paenibacillus fonticola TaxID=379896 RepID=UPI0003772F9C
IGRTHLQAGIVDGAVLQSESVGSSHIEAGAVKSYHLADESIQSHHLTAESVQGEHIQHGAVQLEHLAVTPMLSIHGQPTIQQFGMAAFLLQDHEESTEMIILFDEPFSHAHYVIVAMSNNPGYYATLKSQSPESAILEISRLKGGSKNYGFVTWIAIGGLTK